MSEEKDLLYDLIITLSKLNVKFIVCGGIACVLHGVERFTYDLDILLSMERSNMEKVIKIAKEFNLYPRIPEPVENFLDENIRQKWITEKNALVYTFISKDNSLQLDIFLRYPISFDDLEKNVVYFKMDDIKFAVSSKKDLITAKKSINPMRKKDKFDVDILEELIERHGE